MHYEYWKSGKDGKWYWRLKAASGPIIARSEGYTTKQNCLDAIKLMKASHTAAETNLTPNES